FPYRTNYERYGLVLIESQHHELDVELGMGYRATRHENGRVKEWHYNGGTLSQPYVAEENRLSAGSLVDVRHDTGLRGPGVMNDRMVRKVIWLDPWTYQCWLDGVLVE